VNLPSGGQASGVSQPDAKDCRSGSEFPPSQLIVDRYQALSLLGGGESSDVYKVKDLATGRLLALKIRRPGTSHDEELALNREFYHLSRFTHPNIISVVDFGASSDGRHFFTMEYFEGKPFNEFFASGYSDQLIPAMIQVLQALDAIHCQGLCHCDVKPQNILVAPDVGTVSHPGAGSGVGGIKIKLLDFGFAEKVSFSDYSGGRGTLGYIAPEVLKGTGVDARADIYSLGMVVYEVLTGNGPTSATDILSWLRQQYRGQLPRPRECCPEAPERFNDIVWQMIQRDREARPRSGLEVMETLSSISAIPVQLPATEEPQNYLLATGFVGRDERLARLNELLGDAAQAKGSVVFISGERGIGKSRLLSEFKFLAQLAGATIFPFTPASLGARPQSLLESIISYLKDYHGVNVAAQLQGLSSGSSGNGKQDVLAGISPDDRSAEAEKFRLFETATAELRRVANHDRTKHSLFLLIDDFELFDPTSLEFLRYLVSSLERDRMMIAVCGLNERRLLDLIKSLDTRPHVHHFALTPLAAWETKELVASVLGQIPQLDELAHWIQETTGGNPLFTIETIYSLIDKKILRLSASRWSVQMEELKAYHIPETVSEVIKRRLKRLAPDEMEILRIGAVSGSPLTIEFLRVVLGFEEKQLFNAVSRLKAMGLMRPYAGETISSLLLSSKMLESVVIETITVAERRESHRRVALALELLYPDQLNNLIFDLAHHYTQAGIKDRAYGYSVRAGDRAFAYHLTEQAQAYYETALMVAAPAMPANERLQLIERIAELREVLGHYPDAIDIYMQAIGIIVADKQLCKTSDLMPQYLRRIGLVHQKQNKHSEALQYFESAAAMLKGRVNLLSVNLLNDMGWSHCTQGNYSRAERYYAQVMQLTQKLQSAETEAPDTNFIPRVQYCQAVLEWYRGNTDQALALVLDAISAYQQVEDRGPFESRLSHLTQFAALLYWSRGDRTQALALYEKHLSLQRKTNDVYYLLRTLHGISLIKLDQSDWEGARHDLEEALQIAERISDPNETIGILNNLGLIHEEVGDWERARQSYAQSQRLSIEQGDEAGLCSTLGNLAAIANKRGDLDEADRLLRDAQSIAGKLQQRSYQQAIGIELVKLELRRDRLALAKQHLMRAYRLNLSDKDLRQRPLLRLAAAEYHLQAAEPDRAVLILRPLLVGTGSHKPESPATPEPARANRTAGSQSPGISKDRLLALYFQGQALGQLGRNSEARQALEQTVRHARNLRIPYETGLGLLALANLRTTVNQPESLLRIKPALALRSLEEKDITESLEAIKEARDIFQRLGAKLELQRAEELLERITQLATSTQLRPRHQSEYLRVFYELSEIINEGLEQEDFMDRILDLVIEVTGAERGLLSLVQNDKLVSAAARAIDHTTLEDANTISRTLLKQVKRKAEPIMTADALNDPRFNTSNSVALNKIHSMLCVPLVVGERVIGAIYLDSRINAHLFWEEDRSLLMSVANLLAATIDKSLAFRKIQDDIGSFREEILTDAATGYSLGKSRAMREVYQLVERIAPTDCTVLILGETGSGKGVLARMIHNLGKRKAQRFLPINCGTLPETLFESELFGHARGSFTGAVRDKEGLFEIAEGGTVFMDEITNATVGIQAKLLQAIEEKVIRRVGETETRAVDVRLICATNRDLTDDVKTGKFREDLFYRLNVVTVTVPPLRARTADIPSLAGYFLRRYVKELNKAIVGLEEDASAALAAYQWPGNVRELQHVIERATIMCQKRKIGLSDLGLKLAPDQLPAIAAASDQSAARRPALEREEVVRALAESAGNVSEAAKRLNTHRRQVQRLIKRYSIDKSNLQ
jgi:transcriptional regulator with GAF, ATPase, and Fis domain/serine/threonine protein kinase/tetratricopeptide (TPR) repeat protein